MTDKPTPEQAAAQDVRTRYGDVVAAAERARGNGDSERADELMAAAGRILADEQARAIAQTEQANYARSHTATEPPKDDKAEE